MFKLKATALGALLAICVSACAAPVETGVPASVFSVSSYRVADKIFRVTLHYPGIKDQLDIALFDAPDIQLLDVRAIRGAKVAGDYLDFSKAASVQFSNFAPNRSVLEFHLSYLPAEAAEWIEADCQVGLEVNALQEMSCQQVE